MLTILGYFILAILIYNIPTLIAFARFHSNMRKILVLNIALGWTVIGWCWALTWALGPSKQNYYER